MTKRELTCIGCPLGCALVVTMEGKEVLKVEGNTCKKGAEYGKKECTHPMRQVTSSVRVNKGEIPMVSVKMAEEIPKEKIQDCVLALREITVDAPIHIGDVILEDAAGTGVAVVATKNIKVRA